MIKVENGELIAAGTGSDLMAEATLILNKIYEDLKVAVGEEYAKLQISMLAELATKSDEEIEAEVKEIRKGF